MPPGYFRLAPSIRMSGVSRGMEQLGVLVRDESGERLVAARGAHVVLPLERHGTAQRLIPKQTRRGLREVVRGERHAKAAAAFAQNPLLVGVVVGNYRHAEGEVFN